MADQREINVRGRMIATGAELGGKHLKEANRELRELQKQFTVNEYNGLLMAIRKFNEEDRAENTHLPKLIFGVSTGGMIPDHLVPHYDRQLACTPQAATQVREALREIGAANPRLGIPANSPYNSPSTAAYRAST